MRKQRAGADLRSKLLPAMAMCTEVLCVDKEHKVRIADVDHTPATLPTPGTSIVRCITRGTPISLSIR